MHTHENEPFVVNREVRAVMVPAGNPEEVTFEVHREAAAERLRDIADLPSRQRDRIALRHHDGGAVALEADRFGGLAVTHRSVGASGAHYACRCA